MFILGKLPSKGELLSEGVYPSSDSPVRVETNWYLESLRLCQQNENITLPLDQC